eukprot:4528496-Pleurochrysis_carterae.AAC.1
MARKQPKRWPESSQKGGQKAATKVAGSSQNAARRQLESSKNRGGRSCGCGLHAGSCTCASAR